jgi:hypothetical protein
MSHTCSLTWCSHRMKGMKFTERIIRRQIILYAIFHDHCKYLCCVFYRSCTCEQLKVSDNAYRSWTLCLAYRIFSICVIKMNGVWVTVRYVTQRQWRVCTRSGYDVPGMVLSQDYLYIYCLLIGVTFKALLLCIDAATVGNFLELLL